MRQRAPESPWGFPGTRQRGRSVVAGVAGLPVRVIVNIGTMRDEDVDGGVAPIFDQARLLNTPGPAAVRKLGSWINALRVSSYGERSEASNLNAQSTSSSSARRA